MDFDEWFDNNIVESNITRNRTQCRMAFEAGRQSKQAEINELQKRIDGALKELEDIYFYKTQNSNTAIKILKGE